MHFSYLMGIRGLVITKQICLRCSQTIRYKRDDRKISAYMWSRKYVIMKNKCCHDMKPTAREREKADERRTSTIASKKNIHAKMLMKMEILCACFFSRLAIFFLDSLQQHEGNSNFFFVRHRQLFCYGLSIVNDSI